MKPKYKIGDMFVTRNNCIAKIQKVFKHSYKYKYLDNEKIYYSSIALVDINTRPLTPELKLELL